MDVQWNVDYPNAKHPKRRLYELPDRSRDHYDQRLTQVQATPWSRRAPYLHQKQKLEICRSLRGGASSIAALSKELEIAICLIIRTN